MYLKSSEWIVGYLGCVTWPCQCLYFNLSHPVLRTLFFYSTGDFSEDWDWIVLPFQGLDMGLVYCTWPIPHFHWHSEQIPLLSKGFTGNPLSSSQIFVCVRVCVYLFNVYFFSSELWFTGPGSFLLLLNILCPAQRPQEMRSVGSYAFNLSCPSCSPHTVIQSSRE